MNSRTELWKRNVKQCETSGEKNPENKKNVKNEEEKMPEQRSSKMKIKQKRFHGKELKTGERK